VHERIRRRLTPSRANKTRSRTGGSNASAQWDSCRVRSNRASSCLLRHGVSAFAVVLAALAVTSASGSSAVVDSVRPPHGALIASNIRVSASLTYSVPSPDSRNLYKVDGFDGRSRVVVLRRDARTGQLVELARDRGCSFHCSYADGLNNPVSVAVTPDGLDVIVSNRRAGLSVYRRGRDGSLRMRSCIGWRWKGFQCSSVDAGFRYYPAVAVSPDGRHVYVVSHNGQRRLTLLTRDARTGRLKAVPGPNGCFLWAVRPNDDCQYRINRGFRPSDVTVSPDGKNVYVSDFWGFYVFQRNARTGELRLPLNDACYGSHPTTDCTRVRDLEGRVTRGGFSVPTVGVPRDGRHAYVGRHVFKRDSRTGSLTLLDHRVPYGVSFAPDGRTAYQTGRQLRVYRRTQAGALKLLPQPYGILRGPFADQLVVMPDGRHVYATEQRYVSDPEKVTVYRVAG
jgi:DNA-binding beta-propeller fold protein YncE